jgi:membrane protein
LIWRAIARCGHEESAMEATPAHNDRRDGRDTLPLSELSTRGISGRARAVLRVLRAAGHEYERDYARYFAVAMIYYALVSLVPLLLLLMTSIGWLLQISPAVAAAQRGALDYIQSTFGSDVGSTVERLVGLLEQQSLIPLSVSLVGLLVTASVLVGHLQISFRAIWKCAPILISGPLHFAILRMVAQKLLAFALVVAGGALLVTAFVLIASVNWLMTKRSAGGWALLIPSSLVMVPLTFALLFRFLPPRRVPWRHVWIAALLCGATWLAVTELLALSGTFFGKNLSAYGAVGTLLAAMLWINIVSQCLFYGAELCKVLAQTGFQRAPHPPAEREGGHGR